MNTTDDAINAALRSGDKYAISHASTAQWDEIRRNTVADALRGPSEWTPPSPHRVRVIEVHPEVVADLRDLLFEDDMQGVGYSEFIRRAVEAARRTGLRTDSVPDPERPISGGMETQ